MPRLRRALAVLLLCAGALGAATTLRPAAQRTASAPSPQAGARLAGAAGEPGLVLRLGEGGDEAVGQAPVARPTAEPLDDAAAARVLDRLPPLAAEPRAEPFALRDASLPPPRTGRSVAAPFPPETDAPRPRAAAAEPLAVLRHAPEGEVALAPQLSITFSQPMVEVSSQGALAREAVTARLTPEVPGEWRWVGTRTLLFEPAGRFPMASEFRAVVPAGTRSAAGSALSAAVSWSFATPAPRLVASYPRDAPTRREPLLFASFDQRVEPAAILATLRLRAGGRELPLRLASDSERDADAAVARLVRDSEPGRWVVFTPQQPLPADSAVEVIVGAGTPSAEGPRRTREAQSWAFRTYGPFRVRSHECGWGGRCTPLQPWRVETTNPVDARTLRAGRVRVEPELPGLKVEAWGDAIALRGASRGRTTYRVTLSGEIRDAFGQPLEAPAPLEFTVGRAEAALSGPRQDLVVLDPAGPRTLPVYSINHPRLRVRAYAVSPQDWPAWHEYRQSAWRNQAGTPPGRLAIDTTLPVAGAADELVETRVDLSRALDDGLGQLVVVVEPALRSASARREQAVRLWLQSTRLGLDAFAGGETLLAWATALADGRPLADVAVSLAPGGAERTDGSGLARLALPDTPAPLLVARLGRDVVILPAEASWWSAGTGFRRRAAGESLRFCVFDDRRLYRPGEEVRVKGLLRRIGAGPRGDVEPLPDGIGPIAWTLRDAQGNESGRGRAALGGLGSFDFAVKLPPTMNLGSAALQLETNGSTLPGREHVHAFEVQEFRRPEFEVKAASSEGPFTIGTHATVSVSAAYYAGGALPGADVSWRVATTAAFFRPPNRDDFVFGTFVPWWQPQRGAGAPEHVLSFAGRTDGSGRHRLRIDFDSAAAPRPQHVQAEATVMDVNRQAWTASASLLVHPALHYVGLRTARPFVQRGEPIAVDAIVTDLDGKALAGRPVALRAERLDWEQVDGEWTLVPKDAQERQLESADGAVSARFEAKEGGSWRVLARIHDAQGRVNETELRVWVAGGRVPPRRDLEQESVTLVPDRRGYAAGDVARVLVVAPFAPAEGLLTLRRSGLLREQRFRIEGGSHTLEIPIEDGYTPNLHVQVDLVGAAPREPAPGGAAPRDSATGERDRSAARAHDRPAFASGSLDLPVPPASRTLSLAVSPRESALSPGGTTTLDLALRDAAGRPVAGAEASVVVVDEAVLALTGYRLPNPLETFYAPRESGVTDHRLREQVLLARAEDLDLAPQALAEQVMADAAAPPLLRSAGALPAPAPAAAAFASRRDRRADQDAQRLRGARAVRRERADRRLGTRPARAEAPGQPHALPRDGGGRGGRSAVRLRRGDPGRAAAADGAPVAAALPQLRRPLRAAGRRAEPDRPAAHRGRGRARAQRGPDRGRGPARARRRERPRRGALPDGRGARRDRAGAGRRGLGRRRRRGRGRAAGLDAGHDGGLRDLRPARPGRGRAAGAHPRRGRAAVRRARADDVLDGALRAQRRRPVPRRLPVRVLGAALLPRARGGGAARRARGVPGRGAAEAGRAGGRGDARPRPAARAAGRRRRLRVLAPRGSVLALRVDPRRARPRPSEGQGLRRAGHHARALARLPAQRREAHPDRIPC